MFTPWHTELFEKRLVYGCYVILHYIFERKKCRLEENSVNFVDYGGYAEKWN